MKGGRGKHFREAVLFNHLLALHDEQIARKQEERSIYLTVMKSE